MKDLRATGVTRTVAIDIAATPAEVYRFVKHIENLALGPECVGMQWVEADRVFEGHNKVGDYAWTTSCYVVADEPERRFAWEVETERYVRWTFELQPVATGTRLSHSFEILHLSPFFAGVKEEHFPLRWQALEDGMTRVLQGIKAALEGAHEPAVA